MIVIKRHCLPLFTGYLLAGNRKYNSLFAVRSEMQIKSSEKQSDKPFNFALCFLLLHFFIVTFNGSETCVDVCVCLCECAADKFKLSCKSNTNAQREN